MIIDQMTERECRDFVERSPIGRLGCSLDDQPYIVPVYLAYEADNVYVFSTFGQRITWMRANPKGSVSKSAKSRTILSGRV
jgi:uncharacterized protein